MDIIRTENLQYAYAMRDEEGREIGRRLALDGVELSLREGDFAAVLGRNGSGKSTFAKQLNALLCPTGGTVLLLGMNTRDETKLWDIRKTAGMVFQNPDNQIISSLVEEDVGFGPENLGVPTEEILQRVEKALAAVGMAAYAASSPGRLSGGQKQRVAIAGILAMKPRLIILDEPTAMLDPGGRREVLETVRELNRKEKISVLLITHYMEETVFADRIFVMDSGRLVLQGTPREVFAESETVRALGLELPPAVELAERLRKKGLPLPDGILDAEELTDALVTLKEQGRRT